MADLVVCRVCFDTDKGFNLIETLKLAEKFQACTGVEINPEEEEEDKLPSGLCTSCCEELEHFYVFRLKCIEADHQYRSKIRKNSTLEATEEQIPFLKSSRNKCQNKDLLPYPCPETECQLGFNRSDCLQEHLKKEHEYLPPNFRCEQQDCNKSYRHKGTLRMHMRKCHQLGPALKSHICEFCGRVLKSLTALNDHRFTHKDKTELPYACQEADCSRRFATKEKLKVHLMRHLGIKNFCCPYCGLKKTTRNELKIHINYHTLERTWSCRFCSKVCNSSGNLKMHVRTVHENARDYPCSYCDKKFAKPDTRKYHEMTHTGEKNFECDECGKRFTQPAALRTHRKIHQKKEAAGKADVLVDNI